MKESVEEKIIEIQGKKLKLDSLILQGVVCKEDDDKENQKINLQEVLLHGASRILAQKQHYVQEIEIDLIIAEA